jgi:hypothetical protein
LNVSPFLNNAIDQQAANQSTGNSSLQFQKGSNSSVLYTSQNWDLEDELYEEDSFMKMCKSIEREELQTSKGKFVENSICNLYLRVLIQAKAKMLLA